MIITSTQIALHGLRCYAYHGVLSQERKVGADYTIDLLLTVDIADAALRHDQLEGTIAYSEFYQFVRAARAVPSALLEHAATRILEQLFAHFPTLRQAEITLRKDNPPMGADCKGCSVRLTAQA